MFKNAKLIGLYLLKEPSSVVLSVLSHKHDLTRAQLSEYNTFNNNMINNETNIIVLYLKSLWQDFVCITFSLYKANCIT